MECPACGLSTFFLNGMCGICKWGETEAFDRSETLCGDEDY